jgi:hypothetical protein
MEGEEKRCPDFWPCGREPLSLPQSIVVAAFEKIEGLGVSSTLAGGLKPESIFNEGAFYPGLKAGVIQRFSEFKSSVRSDFRPFRTLDVAQYKSEWRGKKSVVLIFGRAGGHPSLYLNPLW